MNILKSILIGILCIYSFSLVNVNWSKAADWDFVSKSGLSDTKTGTGNSDFSLPGMAGKAVKMLIIMLGILFLGLIIYGGYLYLIDRGNEDKAKEAIKLIQNAVIGLLIVSAAYVITSFVGTELAPKAAPAVKPVSVK
jgi:hypothetical protein